MSHTAPILEALRGEALHTKGRALANEFSLCGGIKPQSCKLNDSERRTLTTDDLDTVCHRSRGFTRQKVVVAVMGLVLVVALVTVHRKRTVDV